MSVEDPFKDPAPIASTFASADSFRGRLVMIEPERLELDVPNQSDPRNVADRLTATVTTLDGQGRVEIYSYKAPTGKYLDGPVHKGVWFSQERIVKAVLPDRVLTPGVRVLGRLETYKPGKPAGPGNPWGIVPATPQEKQAAAQALANLTLGQAQDPADDKDPFAPGGAKEAPF
jgi:hypothetical protein